MSLTRKTLSIYWKYTNRYSLLFWCGTIGSSLGVISQDIIPPVIVAKTFSKLQVAYATHSSLRFSTFVPYFIIFLISELLGLIFWRVQSFCVWSFEIKSKQDLAIDVYDHLQNQGQKFHSDRFGGGLVSQTNKFLGAYERLMDEFIWSVVSGLTALLVSLGVLFFVSYKYALVLTFITSIYMYVMSKRMKKQMPFNIDETERESDQTAALADAITNVSTIRAFASEEHELERFSGIAGKLKSSYDRLSIEVLKTEALSHFQTNGFQIVAFLFGLIAITSFRANVSVLYLVLAYTQGIVGRLWQFGRIVRNINRGFGDAAEMTQILEIETEIQDPEKPEKVTIHRGKIEFNNVTYFYSENKEVPLFDSINFAIKPGEKVGLVGKSGGGKTTITRLLLRFMDIQKGEILIDGQNIANLRQKDLRTHIAYVPQEPMLFHRSLMDNIRYGNPDASEQEVMAIAKLANAHDFIEKLPNGYETLVGERGVKLSGGQRQRVAIARAMLKNSPILVLDEATSALDSESEVLIQDALWKLMENRTAIVIAHRLSTIQKMDRIIVLDQGKIVEQGTHKELIRADGEYAQLWAHQSGGFKDTTPKPSI